MKKQRNEINTQGVNISSENIHSGIKKVIMEDWRKSKERTAKELNVNENELYVTDQGFYMTNNELIDANPKTKKERTPNTLYTLKQMKNMMNKIAEQKMATVEELTQLRNIHKAMTERWIGLELAKPLE